MALEVYGIKTCSTCTKALKWLDAEHIDYTWHSTRVSAPTAEQITGWVKDLGFAPLRNTSGKSYRAIGDEKKSWGDSEWIAAFSKDAMLLKRPLFVKDGKAVQAGFRGTDDEKRAKLS